MLTAEPFTLMAPAIAVVCAYGIAGKFGGNYIWQNGLQAAKNKYWWNLNLAIRNCAYKFLLYHCAHMAIRNCTYKFLLYHCAHMVRLKLVKVMEEFQLEAITYMYKSTSTPLLGEVLECKIEVVTSRIAMQWQFSAGKRLLGMAKYRQLAHCFSKEPEEFTVRLLES